jgi:hypothetical protein
MRRWAVAAATAGAVLVLPIGASALPSGSSPADSTSTIYVNNTVACDPNGGTQTAPFCTIQQAADVVNPGQTVLISTGSYAPFTLTRSGTPTAPLTFAAAGISVVRIQNPAAGITLLAGVHDVMLSHLDFFPAQGGGLSIDASNDVTLDHLVMADTSPAASMRTVGITNGSTDITLSRSLFSRGNVVIDGASHNIVITTNRLLNGPGAAVQATGGAANVDVTSNTITGGCGVGVVVQSASATVENNLVSEPQTSATCSSPAAAIEVSADSASQVTSDYNAVRSTAPWTEYLWAGVPYSTAAQLNIAIGQGAHDVDYTSTTITPNDTTGVQLVDAANANAPGELATDQSDRPHVDDPLVANTGVGTNAPDLGAFEWQDPIGLGFTGVPLAGVAPMRATISFTQLTSAWSEPVTATVDFGDGSPPVTTSGGSVSELYTVPGTYKVTITAADTGGSTLVRNATVVAATNTLPVPTLGVGPFIYEQPAGVNNVMGGSATFTINAAADPWELTSRVLNFGDGTSEPIQTTTWSHQYPSSGTFTATLTDTDVVGRTTKATVTAVSTDEYQSLGPVRDYDSRLTGKQVPAHSTIHLSLAQLNAPASFVDAVQLNVTATRAHSSGYITVYPDGTTRPTVSTLNFATSQTVANEVTATAGSNGVVDFYNGSSAPVDLIVDTFGQEVRNVGASTYVPVSPVRVLDTRSGLGAPKAKVPAGGSITLPVAGANGVPTDAAGAVLNIATTDATTSGYLTVYGDGATRPGTSNSNWSGGTTVSNLAVVHMTDGKIVLYNGGKGPVDFVADLVGYYNPAGMAATYLPRQPVRLLDTRNGTGTGGQIAKLGPGQKLTLQVAGVAGVLSNGTKAASVNITATGASASGYLTVYPDGVARPTASSVNYVSGRSVANMSVMPLGSNGAIDIYNGGSKPVDVIVDLNGTYFVYPSN